MSADLELIVDELRAALERPLPGPAAQAVMAPRPRTGWEPGVIPEDCRRAAALLLVYPGPPDRLLLTRRHDELPDHAGQVSLPGGEIEPGEGTVAAARREAWEEVSLDPELVEVVGQLSPLHIPVSRFVLHPVVAVATTRPELRPSDVEVDRILESHLERLADPRHHRVEVWPGEDGLMQVPLFDIGEEKVWGATAMVLAEFLAVIGAPPRPWPEEEES